MKHIRFDGMMRLFGERGKAVQTMTPKSVDIHYDMGLSLVKFKIAIRIQ